MSSFIKWCKCGRSLLTGGQMRDNQSCYICQKEKQEHAEGFLHRVEEAQQEEKKDGINS